MRILFVGHDVAYAQFYASIEASLRQRTEMAASHVYFRPSGYLAAQFALKVRAHSPSFLRLFGSWPRSWKSDPALLDLRFYKKAKDAAKRERFGRLHEAYYAYFYSLFKNEELDVAILPGEFRLFEQAALKALQNVRHPPQLVFFEAGPPGYIYLDRSGVNANASFRITGESHLLTTAGTPPQQANINQMSIPVLLKLLLQAVDIVWLLSSLLIRGRLDLDEYLVALSTRFKHILKRASRLKTPQLLSGFSVIFIGQVRNDVNHSHFGLSDDDLLSRLISLLENDRDIQLLWRDHPQEPSEELFTKLSRYFPGRVSRAPAMPLSNALKSVEGVVTVNSNGGLEALRMGLPVLLLGQSYFENLLGACIDNESFGTYRKNVREFGLNPRISADAEGFIERCFIPVDYRGEDYSNAHLAAHVILMLNI